MKLNEKFSHHTEIGSDLIQPARWQCVRYMHLIAQAAFFSKLLVGLNTCVENLSVLIV